MPPTIQTDRKLSRFILHLVIFTALLGIVGYVIYRFIPPYFKTPALPFIYLFFFIVSLLIYTILRKSATLPTRKFINYFLLLTMGKLIFFLSVMLVYSLINRADAIPFILAFSALYLFFTTFEVITGLRIEKENEK